MTAEFQLDFFLDEDPNISALRQEVANVRESANKVRKGIFARHNELAKLYLDAHERLEILERNICQRK